MRIQQLSVKEVVAGPIELDTPEKLVKAFEVLAGIWTSTKDCDQSLKLAICYFEHERPTEVSR